MHIRIFLEFLEKYKCLCIDFPPPQGSRCVFNEQPCLKFKLWCQRRLLRVPWTARRSNQSILKEVNREYSLEGLKLKLRLQYIGCLMWRTNSLEKIPMHERLKVKEEEGGRGWDGWIASLIQWIWTWANSRRVRDREAWHAAVWGCKELDMT